MSTKTTLKRIALVAVSALGFGLMSSVAPANAAAVTSITPAFTSYTTVGSSDLTAIVRLVVKDSLGDYDSLSATTGETMTAQVLGSMPNQVGTVTACTAPTITSTTSTGTNLVGTTGSNPTRVFAGGIGTTSAPDSAVQYFKIAGAANCLDAGYYTVRFTTFTTSSADIVGGYVDVKFGHVNNTLGLSGAVITLTSEATTVTQDDESAFGGADGELVTVSWTDANGGVIISGQSTNPAIYRGTSYARTGNIEYRPTVDIQWNNASTATVSYETAVSSFADDGSTNADDTANDGVYSVKWNAELNAKGERGLTTRSIRAYFAGNTKVTKSLTALAPTASSTAIFYSVSGTGKYEATAGSSTTGGAYQLPLTTKSATYSVYVSASSVALTGYSMYYSVDYSGCVLGDMTPAESDVSLAPTKVLTDANGLASVTITHANPADGCAASITWTGAATNVSATTITWKQSVPTTVVSDPAGNIQALLKSTNKITWTIFDQFGAAVVGKTVTLTMTGENAPTAGLASVITDANGQVSYEWTDALAATTETDKVYVSAVGTTAFTSTTGGPVTVTYKTTLDTISSLDVKYTTSAVTTAAVIPATAIGGSTGRAISAADQLDNSKSMTSAVNAATSDTYWVKYNVTHLKSDGITAVTGIPTTVTVTGAYLLDTAGKFATTRKIYGTTTGLTVVGTKTGVATVTFTNGSLTKSSTINFVNVNTDARVLALTENAGTFTATVTDFAGNAVADATINVSATGDARFGNSGSSTSFVSDANGKVSFNVTGAGTVTASLAAATYTKTAYLKDSGNSTGTVVTPGAPAGVRSVAVATSGKADANLAAAEAASDAAAEAIDAANAATDAANLAAEAADAATVAAEEARDAADAATAAVEELATQVATLMAALKAQITTLANTVAKIAKKVKA